MRRRLIRVTSGGRIDPHEVDSDLIELSDIVTTLSRLARWNGQGNDVITVAQHSCVVARYLAQNSPGVEYAVLGLLHDAHEAYIGDIIVPVSDMLPQINAVRAHFDSAIYRKFRVAPPTHEQALAIEAADRVVRATEMIVLFGVTRAQAREECGVEAEDPDWLIPETWSTVESALRYRHQVMVALNAYHEACP